MSMNNHSMIKIAIVIAIALASTSQLCAQDKITIKETPVVVQELLAKKYARYEVVGVRFNKVKTEYKVELEKGSRTVSLVLATDATVLSKSKGRIYSYDGTEKPPYDSRPHDEDDGHEH